MVEIFHSPSSTSQPGSGSAAAGGDGDGGISPARTVLWDRKTDGGFPETKELKRRVRDVIEPGRDLGHVDRNHARPNTTTSPNATGTSNELAKAGTTEAQQQQQPQKDKPSRAELEAAAEATTAAAAACESKKGCEDCD